MLSAGAAGVLLTATSFMVRGLACCEQRYQAAQRATRFFEVQKLFKKAPQERFPDMNGENNI